MILSLFSLFFACCDFLIMGKEGVVNGRSMEFQYDLHSQLIIHPAGETVQSNAPDNQKGISWTSKYGYACVDAFNLDRVVDGLNEKGLSFGALWLDHAKYQPAENKATALDVHELGSWILGNFATVNEVKEALQKVEVWSPVSPALGIIPALHFSIHDALGKSLVVEFIDGKMEVHDNPTSVLTNQPSFPWHLSNLKNYVHLTHSHAKEVEVNGLKLNPQGSGGGFLGMPGDWTSPSRFVKVFFMKHYAETPENSDQTVNQAIHFLNAMDIPKGIVHYKGQRADYTQWIIVKDLVNKKIYFRTYDNQMFSQVDLMKELANRASPLRTSLSVPQKFSQVGPSPGQG